MHFGRSGNAPSVGNMDVIPATLVIATIRNHSITRSLHRAYAKRPHRSRPCNGRGGQKHQVCPPRSASHLIISRRELVYLTICECRLFLPGHGAEKRLLDHGGGVFRARVCPTNALSGMTVRGQVRRRPRRHLSISPGSSGSERRWPRPAGICRRGYWSGSRAAGAGGRRAWRHGPHAGRQTPPR